MASTWTLNNAVEKIADGEKTDTWGQITNRNFDILDRAASGVGTIDLSSSAAAHTLSTTDGTTGDALSDGMHKVLVLSGATEDCTITVSPNDATKFYLVDNNSGYDCTFTQGTGDNVTVANGSTGIIYCDGSGAAANVRAIIDATTLTTLGITASAAELNILEGVTATTAELNYNDITTIGLTEASKVVTADANGDVNISEELKAKSYNDTFSAITSSSGTATLNCETGNVFSLTLSENVSTFTWSNPPASGTAYGFSLKVIQDASASGYTIAWPASVDFPSGTAPTLTDTASAVDQFVFYTHDGGTTWYGFTAGKDLKTPS